MHLRNEKEIKQNQNHQSHHQHTPSTSTSSSTSSTDSGVVIDSNAIIARTHHNNIGGNISGNNRNKGHAHIANGNIKNINLYNESKMETKTKDKIDNETPKVDNARTSRENFILNNNNSKCSNIINNSNNNNSNNNDSNSNSNSKNNSNQSNNHKINQNVNNNNANNENGGNGNGNGDGDGDGDDDGKTDGDQVNDECNARKKGNTAKHNISIENILNITTKVNSMRQDKAKGGNMDGDGDGDGESERGKASPKRNCSPNISIRSTTISIASIDENAIDSSIVDSDSECEADAEGIHTNYVVKKLGQQTTYAPGSPDLPNINKGLTVISQKISPNGTLPGNMLNGGFYPSSLAEKPALGGLTPTSPQIGSIALTNSTDVTFGDKHFYEGPVTIQQILVDSRDKWKSGGNGNGNASDGHDNPAFTKEYEYSGNGPKVPNPPTQAEKRFGFLRKRRTLLSISALTVLTILATVIYLMAKPSSKSKQQLGDAEDSRKNIPINSTIELDNNFENDTYEGPLLVMSREDWLAREPTDYLDDLKLPVFRVIISHTASDTCFEKSTCIDRVRVIQDFHMDSMKWDDIGYNFLIGGDGRVYTGRGWNKQGAHTKGYNRDSIGISFIGTFTTMPPPQRQILAAQQLIEEGVRLQKLPPDFCIYGARQLGATESPGSALYNIIKTWPHWSKTIACNRTAKL